MAQLAASRPNGSLAEDPLESRQWLPRVSVPPVLFTFARGATLGELHRRVEQFLRDKNYKIKLDYGAFPDRPYDSPGTWGDPTKINRILANDTCKRA